MAFVRPALVQKAKKSGKKTAKFVIDCAQPVEDRVLDVASFDKFLHDHIKVGGKAGALGDSVVITREKTKISITAELPFAKRYPAKKLMYYCSVFKEHITTGT